jgi:hypothetical protein
MLLKREGIQSSLLLTPRVADATCHGTRRRASRERGELAEGNAWRQK